MSAPTITAVRAKFPELTAAAYSDALVQSAIETSTALYALGTIARLYLVAHLAVIAKAEYDDGALDGGSGVIKSEQIGPRLVSYVTQSVDGTGDAFYERTSYGRTYLELRKASPKRIMPFVAG